MQDAREYVPVMRVPSGVAHPMTSIEATPLSWNGNREDAGKRLLSPLPQFDVVKGDTAHRKHAHD